MKKILLLAAASVIFAACTKDNPADISNQAQLKNYATIASDALVMASAKAADPSAQNDEKLNTMPFKPSGSGTISYVPNGCGSGSLRFVSNGNGQSNRFGAFTQLTTFCINSVTGQPMGPITGTGTGANGDKFFYTFVNAGVDEATGLTFQEYDITGGTGRFVNATGSMKLTYHIFEPTSYSYTGDGTLIY
jgi:hypothetical protein